MQQGHLQKFLDAHRAETKSGLETHQLFGHGILYSIPDEKMDEFYRLYCNYVANNGPLTITEKMTRIGPLRVDLDFLYDGHVEDHKHTRAMTISFVKAYMAEAARYVQIPEITDVFVMEKPEPTFYPGKKESKSGIHLVVPEVRVNRNIELAIRNTLLPKMDEFFPGLDLKKDWRETYDKSPLNHTSWWALLGSKKPAGEGATPQPYQLKYSIEWDPNDVNIAIDEEVNREVKPENVRKFSIRSPSNSETPFTEMGQAYALREEEVRISGGAAVVPQRGRPAQRNGDPGSRGSSPTRTIYLQPLSESMLKYYEGHVFNLNAERYNSHDERTNVGHCLKNIHPELDTLWLEFCSQRQDGKYDPREAMAKWQGFNFRNDGAKLGIGSLRHWSRTDDPIGYLEIEKRNIDRLLDEATDTQTEHDMAQVVYAKFRDEFKCARFSASAWYWFAGHTWRETDKGVSLQCRLSSDVFKDFFRKETEISNMMNTDGFPQCPEGKHEPNGCDWCKADKKRQAYAHMRKQLRTTRFKENVMKESRELFLDEDFATKVDENKNLIAFANGVFDTLTFEFRDGKPEDYISFCTNLEYHPDRPHDSYPCWAELNKFLNDVLPDPDVREYFLSYLATSLSGNNEAQKFHILTGSGSNGKSMLMNLTSTAMGDYACKAPISLLTQARNKSAAAAPELVRMKGRRFVTMQEPDEQVPLNTGLMKELASSEKITARDLYAGSKQMLDFDLQARFNLACNEKPKINTQDGGTWRRLVVINFLSKFVSDPRLPNEKPIDESIVQKSQSKEWAEAFLSYLVFLYTKGKGFRKLTPPEKVMEYTSEYKEDSDVIAKFLHEKIHVHPPLAEDEQPREPTSWTSITSSFSEWKRTNELMGKGTPAELKKRIEASHGKLPRGGWTSFRCGDA
jgi:P4 family phage/plasmid primase-like protien